MRKVLVFLAVLSFLCVGCGSGIRMMNVSGQVQISKTPPAWVLEMYQGREDYLATKVAGVRNPETGQMWAKSEKLAFHEQGHELWAMLTEVDHEQWERWFSEKIFVSAYSQTDKKEFFAEHYHYYVVNKVFVPRPNWPDRGFYSTYAKAFPSQFEWFQSFGTRFLSARKEK